MWSKSPNFAQKYHNCSILLFRTKIWSYLAVGVKNEKIESYTIVARGNNLFTMRYKFIASLGWQVSDEPSWICFYPFF